MGEAGGGGGVECNKLQTLVSSTLQVRVTKPRTPQQLISEPLPE